MEVEFLKGETEERLDSVGAVTLIPIPLFADHDPYSRPAILMVYLVQADVADMRPFLRLDGEAATPLVIQLPLEPSLLSHRDPVRIRRRREGRGFDLGTVAPWDH